MIQKLLAASMLLAMSPALTTQGCEGDIDMDGLPDSEDNCESVYNPSQDDNDANGVGNACDALIYEGATLDGCFSTNYPPLRGTPWEERPTWIQQGDVDASKLHVTIDWGGTPAWVEEGPGLSDGQGIWFRTEDTHNPYWWTRTDVEGVVSDTTGDGRVDTLTGTWQMWVCDGADSSDYCMLFEAWEVFNEGDWNGKRVNSIECQF